ncbi:MAG: hypothetical protein KL863_22530 [Rhizobium sp.]|nr:hypothetical protein [Rhizobium sp.]
MRGRIIITGAALFGALGAGTSAQAWTSKQFRDWTVECSNGLTCDMSYSDWSAKGLQSVGFQRKGAPGAGGRAEVARGAGFLARRRPRYHLPLFGGWQGTVRARGGPISSPISSAPPTSMRIMPK